MSEWETQGSEAMAEERGWRKAEKEEGRGEEEKERQGGNTVHAEGQHKAPGALCSSSSRQAASPSSHSTWGSTGVT